MNSLSSKQSIKNMKPKTDLEPDNNTCIKSEEAYPDYVADCDRVKDERLDGVNQVKMENQLDIEVKSEKADIESMMSVNMDSLTPNEELNIKPEYDDDYVISDLGWDRIKVEEKLESGIEVDSAGGAVDQLKMEFQDSETVEEKPDSSGTHFEYIDALGLHEDFDIKTEIDESDEHDSATNSAQIRKKRKGGGKKLQGNRVIEKHDPANTVQKGDLGKHTARKRCMCKYCNKSFLRKQLMFDHILRRHPNFIGTISSKIYECMHCAFKLTNRLNFIKHMVRHDPRRPLACIKCNVSFKSKQCLDNHIIQKHPELGASVSCKINECKLCEYKTTYPHRLTNHIMIKHTGAKFACSKCDASFTNKRSLDNHILQKHPEFAASMSLKIHGCTRCQYKTIFGRDLDRHMMKHTKLKCKNCDKSFTSQRSIDNHILQNHPNLADSVTGKIYECTHCEYKTVQNTKFDMHMMKHTGAKLKCVKCGTLFVSRLSLDDHILQKHPELIASVSLKIHKCTHCEYKTTRRHMLTVHMWKHPGAASFTKDEMLDDQRQRARTKVTCVKCDASFVTKLSLDHHTLQKHPELADSVSRKIHECTQCKYKTVFTQSLAKHMKKHTGAKLTCLHCDASFKRKKSLDNHMLQRHQLTASVSDEIHECMHCKYKTTTKHKFTVHMKKHPGTKPTCTKCDTTFLHKRTLDDHILHKHPELIASLSNKIHACTHCQYKTIFITSLRRHVAKHT